MDTLYDLFCPCGCFHAFKDQEVGFLKEFQYWFLILNWEQGFLGRSLLILKAHKTDEQELSRAEVLEKHEAYIVWRNAVDKAFGVDKVNQSQLGNEEFLHKGHLHWHFVPRHRKPISFAGMEFQGDTSETQKLNYSLVHKRMVHPVGVRWCVKKELSRYLHI